MGNDKLLYLSAKDVEQTRVSTSQIIEALEDAYNQKGMSKTQVPAKIGIYPQPNSLIHAMPAHIEKTNAAGMKWVSAFSDNYKYDKPQINALVILSDSLTGNIAGLDSHVRSIL